MRAKRPFLKKVDRRSIPDLLKEISRKKLGLPSFQRDFVWKPMQMARLIESVIRNYPIGTLMWLPYESNKDMGVSWFEESMDSYSRPRYLVIDGQQRMRSFMHLLRMHRQFGEVPAVEYQGAGYHFFIRTSTNINKLPPCETNKNTFVVFEESDGDRWLDIKAQADNEWMPLIYILDVKYIKRWFAKAYPRPRTKKARAQLRNMLEINKHLTKNYYCPVEIISRKLNEEDHKNIFGLLNEAGTDLTTFDLLSAELHERDFRLRDLWNECQKRYPIINEYQLDPTYLFKVMALIHKHQIGDAVSCKKKDIRGLPKSYKESLDRQIKSDWEDACKFTAVALQSMRDDFGAVQKKYIPYGPMIITLAAIKWWIHKEGFSEKSKGLMQHKIRRWYWGSIFANAYEKSTDNIVSQHFNGLCQWLKKPGAHMKMKIAVKMSYGEVYKNIAKISSSSDARYKALLCIPLVNRAPDIYSNTILSSSVLHDHHIFPKKCREVVRGGVSDDAVNHVSNRMLITDKTNMEIKNRSPREYAAKIKGSLLRRHLLPADIARANFYDFSDKRSHNLVKALHQLIR
jgi:hypothetical protein